MEWALRITLRDNQMQQTTLLKQAIEEVNFVVGRLLAEYNAFDGEDETKWSKVSTQLTDFIQEVKTDERLPLIIGASEVSKLHKAYLEGSFKLFTHEINMHLMSHFTEAELDEIVLVLGRGYFSSLKCLQKEGSAEIDLAQATSVFDRNRWLISLYLIRMNYFTPIVQIVGVPNNEA